jgi:phosphatidate cytidylyltransferase
MLKQRVITAVVLLMVSLPALFHTTPIWLGVLGVLLILAASWEWGRLNDLGFASAFVMPAICLVLFLSYWSWHHYLLVPKLYWLICIGIWFCTIVFYLKNGSPSWNSTPKLIRLALGLFVLISTGLALLQAKLIGTGFLTSVLLLVWTADIAAYFVGRRWGRHKLAPTISPGKSIEGLMGAVVAVWILAIAWIAVSSYLMFDQDSIFSRLFSAGWPALLVGLALLTLTSAAGDLFESMIKRAAGVKDSSQLLPGHGGVLDRLDALLPVLPLAVLISML